ncbi:MAG: hypothetical protein Tsb0034_14430 [Ekhidna sp.]
MKKIIHLCLALAVYVATYAQPTDSLLSALETTEGEERIDLLHELVIDLWLNYPEQGMKYAQESLELSRQLGDSTRISKSLRMIAGVQYYKSEFEASLEYNRKALQIATLLKDTVLINNVYNNIGLLYFNLGNYEDALEYLMLARSMKDQIDDVYGLSATLNNIGLVFERVGAYDEARKYFLEAYDVAVENDDIHKIYALNNIGNTYLHEARGEIAETYFRQALRLSREAENINWGSVSLRGIGEVFILREAFDSARYYCEASLKASQSIDDKKGIAEAYYVLSKYAMAAGEMDAAVNYLQQSKDVATSIHLRHQLLDNMKLFIEIYKQMNQKDMVIAYQEEYLQIRDSLFTDLIWRNLTLVPIKLKEQADRVKLTSQQAEIQSKSFTNRLYAIIILVSVPLFIVLIVLLRKNKRAHDELLANNEELKRTQKLLITSEKMASLGVMAAGIAHEVNNPLNFIKNGVEALNKKINEEEEIDKDELKPIFTIVNEGVKRATNIVKSLSHFSRKSPKMDEECDLKEIIENCLLILHNQIKGRVRIKTKFLTKSKVPGNEGRLHQAVLNIIANAAQAIEGTGAIEITTLEKGKTVELRIKDDGEGIPEENLSKISDPFFTTKAPGEGTGLGLFITFSIIDEHGGNIEVISTSGEGTEFIITLPKK